MTIVQYQIFFANTLTTLAFAKHSSLYVFCINLLEQTCDYQKRNNVPPEVDFEFSRSLEKSES